ncbi:MAG: hypothetical protein AB7F50_11770 [Fimbriimonadaceae bacterium]
MGKPGHKDLRFAELDDDTGLARAHIVLDLDGGTRRDVETGHAVLDAWIADLSLEAGIDLGLSIEAEASSDPQDVAEAAGRALGSALHVCCEAGDQVVGLGHAVVPRGECLILVAIDLQFGPGLELDLGLVREGIGSMPCQGVMEFFRSLSSGAGCNLHVKRLAGKNDVHTVDAAFRALGLAIGSAIRRRDDTT